MKVLNIEKATKYLYLLNKLKGICNDALDVTDIEEVLFTCMYKHGNVSIHYINKIMLLIISEPNG